MTMDQEFIALTNDSFSFAAGQAFRDLQDDISFVDVTLACSDNRQIQAHKVVLVLQASFSRKYLQ